MPVGVTFWFPVYPTSTRLHVFIPKINPFPHASNVLNLKQQHWRGRGKDIRKRFNNFECGCRCLRYQYGRWSVEFNAKRSCDLILTPGSVSVETKMGFKRKKVSTCLSQINWDKSVNYIERFLYRTKINEELYHFMFCPPFELPGIYLDVVHWRCPFVEKLPQVWRSGIALMDLLTRIVNEVKSKSESNIYWRVVCAVINIFKIPTCI